MGYKYDFYILNLQHCIGVVLSKLTRIQDKETEAVEQLIHQPLRIHLKSLAVVVQCAVALFLTMSATSSSLMSLAPAQSLSQPRRVKLVQSPTSLSVSLPISRMLCLKSNHQRNLVACCSLNVQDSAGQDTPIEKSNVFLRHPCIRFACFLCSHKTNV